MKKNTALFLLDLPIIYGCTPDEAYSIVEKIELDNGTKLVDVSNREWRLEHPSTVFKIIGGALSEVYGKPNMDPLDLFLGNL